MILHIKVKAGSKVRQLAKDSNGNWLVKINAPPIEGKANREVIRFLAEILDASQSSIQIITGHKNPHKKICIDILEDDEILFRLEKFLHNKK